MRFARQRHEFERPRGSRGILPLIAAAIAAGGIRAGVGLLQGRNETRRQRDRINDAYTRGHERQNIMQQDVRQSAAEGIASRGLAQGGDIQIGGAVSPASTAEFSGYDAQGNLMSRSDWDAQQKTARDSAMSVSGAHTLGGQQQADLHREQGLEQNDLLQQRDNAVSDTEAAGQQGAVNSIASGIATGFQVAGMGGAASSGPNIPTGTPNPTGTPMPSISGAYASAGIDPHYGGIHPTEPWGLGGTNAGFNKYNGMG